MANPVTVEAFNRGSTGVLWHMLPLWGFSDGAWVYTGRLSLGVNSCTIGLAATVVILWVTVV